MLPSLQMIPGGMPVVIRSATLLLFLLWAGCAPHNLYRPEQLLQSGLPRQVSLQNVPYFQQKEYHCGPAALAMAMSARGVGVSPDEMAGLSFSPGKKGAYQSDMISAVRRRGMLAYRLESSLNKVLANVQNGYPVIVLLNLGLQAWPMYHYALVVGYDLDSDNIELQAARESGREREVLPMFTFLNVWQRAGAWGMLVLLPGETPYEADHKRYMEAVLGLKRAEFLHEAALSFEAAREIWPDSVPTLMGLANLAYRSDEPERAIKLVREAISIEPNSPAVLINYAYLLAQLGNLDPALNIALKAGNLDDGSCGHYCVETLQSIREQKHLEL